jgi:FkbM family methyltransferase
MKIAKVIALCLFVKSHPQRSVTRRKLRWELDLREAIDLSIYLTGSFQRKVVSQAIRSLRHQTGTFVDIGCNRGAISLPVAAHRPSIQVVSIDPVPSVLTKLQRVVELNPQITNIRTLCAFLDSGDTNQRVRAPETVDASWNVFGESSVPSRGTATSLSTNGCVTISLDRLNTKLNLSPIRVIKLDVDGYELEVLHGAINILREHKPIILMEWARESLLSRDCNPKLLAEFLSSERYVPRMMNTFGFRPTRTTWTKLLQYPLGASCELILNCEQSN